MSSSGGSSHTPARCLYEALGVPRDVSADALKKAYYKKALAHHPDKCVGSGRDPDEARARFQEIQHAYAVLSDSRERTFYDEHRDQILGDDGDEGGRLFNFMPFFRPDSFKGHGDDPEGFYAVFGRVFGKIFESEMSEYQGRDPPQFGSSLSPYDEVKAFYNFWGSFSSRLNFSWEDEWNCNDAPNRRVRRAMEKDNNRARSDARREYNLQVQHLVTWVKDLDKRVVAERRRRDEEDIIKAAKKKEAAAQKAQDYQARREAWLLSQQEESPPLSRNSDEDDDQEGPAPVLLADLEHSSEDEQESEVQLIFRCAVCKKDFKSDKQMKQHENSKAHKKRLDEVEKQLLMEALLDTGGSSSGSDSDSEASAESSEDDLARSGKADLEFTEHDGESFSSDTSSQSADDSDSSSSSGDFDLAFLRRKNRAATLEGSASSSDECDELANEVEDSSNAMKSLALHDSTEIAPEDEDRLSSTENLAPRDSADQTQNSNVDEAALPSKSKVGKRKNKKVTRLDDANMSSANACKVCGAPFPSRSKLFEHIKAKGHAAVKGPS